MTIAASLLPEFDAESASTRRVLACIPDTRASWRPHAKSWTIVELATHIANLPTWVGRTFSTEEFDIASVLGLPRPKAGTPAETLDFLDANTRAARAVLAQSTDASCLAPWTLKQSGVALFTLPRIAVLRSFVLSHQIHHRGQMTVYLRLIDVAVPSVYGPTADTPS